MKIDKKTMRKDLIVKIKLARIKNKNSWGYTEKEIQRIKELRDKCDKEVDEAIVQAMKECS